MKGSFYPQRGHDPRVKNGCLKGTEHLCVLGFTGTPMLNRQKWFPPQRDAQIPVPSVCRHWCVCQRILCRCKQAKLRSSGAHPSRSNLCPYETRDMREMPWGDRKRRVILLQANDHQGPKGSPPEAGQTQGRIPPSATDSISSWLQICILQAWGKMNLSF